MHQWLDDLIFYLPGFMSVPIVIAGMLVVWLAWKLLKPRKKTALPPPPKAAPAPQDKGIDKTGQIG